MPGHHPEVPATLRGRPVTADDFQKNNLSVVQRYRILGKKGEGSFAEVMACQNMADGQLYACKTLKRHFLSVDQALALTEVRALRRLRPHLNVIQLHDIIFDKKSGRLALVFELMDLNMYELLKARQKPLPEFRVKSYMYQLLSSLHHIHRHGIFHRDVKPENLLIRDNLLKLGDFGSCRGIHTKRPYTEYISTRWYRPPECLLTSGHYTYKMDIWAAGCVFFEALTNLPLFPGSSEIDQISKIHNVLGTPKPALLAKLRRHRRLSGVDFCFDTRTGIGLTALCPGASTDALQLLSALCAYDEEERPNARASLRSAYFSDLRLAERYHHPSGGRRTASSSKHSASSPLHSPLVSSRADENSPGLTIERKKRLLLPSVEIKVRELSISPAECKSHRSVNLPPIARRRNRKKKSHRNHMHASHVSHLPPIHQPWRP